MKCTFYFKNYLIKRYLQLKFLLSSIVGYLSINNLYLDFIILDRKILNKVLEYSDEYQVDCVKLHVDSILFMKVYARQEVEKTVQIAMEDLRISEKYGLKETRRLSYNILVSENTCISYDGTMFNELSSETKYDIITGKLKKYLHTLPPAFQNLTFFRLLASVSKDAKER